MRTYRVNLKSVEEIKEFVQIVSKYGYDITLERNEYRVDAKSIMGVLRLGLGVNLILNADTDNAMALKKDLSKFLV